MRVHVAACSTLSEPIAFVARKYGVDPMPHYAIFNGLLLVLLVLHTYWSWLILQVRPARSGAAHAHHLQCKVVFIATHFVLSAMPCARY